MADLRSFLLEPADRYDVELASRRGLLAGGFQAGLHLMGFAALFVLGLTLDVVQPDAVPAARTATVFWGGVVLGGGAGAGMVALAGRDRVDRLWRTPAGRLGTVLVVYAAFWALLATIGVYAVFAGLAFVLGRVVAHGWLVATRG